MKLAATDRQNNSQPTTPSPVVKGQGVRLMDITVLGPMMILSAMGKNPPGWLRLGMVAIGVGTVLYNARNYFQVEKDLKKPPI